MKNKAIPFLLALALTAPMALIAQADAPATATTTLDKTMASRLVYGWLSGSRYAYRPRVLDEAAADQVFDKYLESLDRGKQYFLKSDIDGFAALREQVAEAIRNGNTGLADEVFAVYRKRAAERVAHVRQLLKTEPDFTLDETYEYDREDAAWAADVAELDEIWRKSVKSD